MPAPTRTPVIKGRVLRNLTRRGLSLESVQDEEIYSELTDAQNHILDDITRHNDSIFPRANLRIYRSEHRSRNPGCLG